MAKTLLIEPPDIPASAKLGATYVPSTSPKQAACNERRAKPRKNHPIMVPMAPWDSEATLPFANLRYATVRCLDLSDGGLAIVLPILPRFTQAVFCLVMEREQVHLLARIKDLTEGAYYEQRQFRIGFQFTDIVSPDGTFNSMPVR